jgi:hypothetical protein
LRLGDLSLGLPRRNMTVAVGDELSRKEGHRELGVGTETGCWQVCANGQKRDRCEKQKQNQNQDGLVDEDGWWQQIRGMIRMMKLLVVIIRNEWMGRYGIRGLGQRTNKYLLQEGGGDAVYRH